MGSSTWCWRSVAAIVRRNSSRIVCRSQVRPSVVRTLRSARRETMHHRITGVMVIGAIAAAVALDAQAYKTPRTPWGHPDLQGYWTNTTTTPLQRPPELKD